MEQGQVSDDETNDTALNEDISSCGHVFNKNGNLHCIFENLRLRKQ